MMPDPSRAAPVEAGRRRSRIVSALRIVAGFVLILVGLFLALPGVPGPGLVVVVLGLALLADHFTWARRWLDWGKAKLEQVKARVGKHPPSPGA